MRESQAIVKYEDMSEFDRSRVLALVDQNVPFIQAVKRVANNPNGDVLAPAPKRRRAG